MVATVPDREREICMRFRGVRLDWKWSQPDFAAELGITRVRLASYEYGRAPIRYDLAKQLCRRFEVNQRFLATGKRPRWPDVPIPEEIDRGIEGRELFSVAYDSRLGEIIESYLQKQAALLKCDVKDLEYAGTLRPEQPEPESGDWKTLHRAISLNLIQFTRTIPPQLQQDFFSALVDAACQFSEKHKKLIEKCWRQARPGDKKHTP